MKANTQNISSALGVSYSVMVPEEPKLPEVIHVDNANMTKADSDYEFARGNMIDVIDIGKDALEELVDFAKQAQEPRAFEVVGQLMEKLINANEKLLKLSKDIKDIKKEEIKREGPETVNNTMVLTSAEFLKMLKEKDA